MLLTRYSQLWRNRECKKHARRKKLLYNKAKGTDLIIDWFRFKDAATRLRKTCKKAYNNFISSTSKLIQNYFLASFKAKEMNDVRISPLRKSSTMQIPDKD